MDISAATIARSSLVRRYMRGRLDEHRDPRTGEVSATTLAEDAAAAFDLYEDDQVTIVEETFETAAELATSS